MKTLLFLGDSLKSVQSFPAQAQHKMGFELKKVQQGLLPDDSKPITSIGPGVEEIRVWVESGTYRVIYIARMAEAVYVLHAFQKKSQQTSQQDIKLARSRFDQLKARRT